ncbi:MAG: L,D-transpeptidase, partial [Acidimicrobiia bacterium]
ATTPVSEQVPPSLSTTTTTIAPSATTRPSTTTGRTAETAAPVWTAARAEGRLAVFATPRSDRPFRTLERTTILGTPTVVFVLDATEDWLKVMVPGRPNGQTGWVRQADVVMYEVGTRAAIDLSDRTITVFEGETKIFETSVGIGSPAAPTPTGLFFITDAVRITNPNGPWGPYAFGLSARSDTVTEFNGGDGIIGVHGTNRPNSIGEAQSLGCVRLPNDVMLELSELLSVGSPVTIEA